MIQCEVIYMSHPSSENGFLLLKEDNKKSREFHFSKVCYDKDGKLLTVPRVGQKVWIYNSIMNIDGYDLLKIKSIPIRY